METEEQLRESQENVRMLLQSMQTLQSENEALRQAMAEAGIIPGSNQAQIGTNPASHAAIPSATRSSESPSETRRRFKRSESPFNSRGSGSPPSSSPGFRKFSGSIHSAVAEAKLSRSTAEQDFRLAHSSTTSEDRDYLMARLMQIEIATEQSSTKGQTDPEPGYGSSKARPIPRKIEVVPPSSQSASSSNRLARFTPLISSKDRFITDVSVLGYTYKGGANVYVIHSTYSDRERFEVFRRYGEFFSFQSTLKQLFPKTEITLPVLPTIDNVLSILGRTNSGRVLKSRLNTINEYCQTLLLHLPHHVSKSVFVQSFFRAHPGDRQLERLRRPRGETLLMSVYPQKRPAGSSFEEYVVIADHDASNGNELSVKAGDVIRVIDKGSEGWWLVSKVDSVTKKGAEKLGFIPGAFVRKYEGRDELETTAELEEKHLGFVSSMAMMDELNSSLKYNVIADYTTDDPRQISLSKDSTIIVVEKNADGWWLVTQGYKEGWAPSSFLEPVGSTRSESESTEAELCENLPSEDAPRYITDMAYHAAMDDEVSFPKGVMIEVLQKNTSGWWRVRYGHREGIAPASFLSLPTTMAPPELHPVAMPEKERELAQDKKKALFKMPVIGDFSHTTSGIHEPPPRRKWVTEHPQRYKRRPSAQKVPEEQPVAFKTFHDQSSRDQMCTESYCQVDPSRN